MSTYCRKKKILHYVNNHFQTEQKKVNTLPQAFFKQHLRNRIVYSFGKEGTDN